MPLVLYLETTDPSQGAADKKRVEVMDRLTVGRGSDNALVLPDPNRHLSKNHCVITFDGTRYFVTDLSRNGTFLDSNPERLTPNVPVALIEGAVIRLGGYALTVGAISPSALLSSMRSGPPAASPDDGLFGDPLGSPHAHDPLHANPDDNPLGTPSSAADPFGDFDFPPAREPQLSAVVQDEVDVLGNRRPNDGWQGASHSDHAPAEQAFFRPPKVVRDRVPDDWDPAELGVPLNPALLKQPAQENHPDPPVLPQAPTASAPAYRPAPQMAPAGDNIPSIASFMRSMGLPPANLTPQQSAAFMENVAKSYAIAIQGLLDLIAARATMKQEFRIERTVLGASGNNPLKFSHNFDEVMRLMLITQPKGYLSAPEAVGDALADVKAHQLALMAGMQAALATILERFDPAALEKRLEQGSLLDGILPGAKKAKYWDLFKSLYQEIAGELKDDFQREFGERFARAYQDQIRRS